MKKLSWLFLVILPLACQDDQQNDSLQERTTETIIINRSSSGARLTTTNGINCNESTTFDLTTFNGNVEGFGTITINEEDIAISFDVSLGEWFFLDVRAYAGDCNAVPDPASFPYQQTFSMNNEIRQASLSIPMANLPDCGCVHTYATVARFSPVNSQLESYPSTASTEYCNCDEPEEPDDKNLRTQTPGGWGAPPSGNNPGTYLHANFSSAFPAGLVVGCDYTITLTSAQAVTDFLPQGGKSGSLTQNYWNPVNTPKSSNNPKNVLSGHIVALTLSTTFDAWDDAFGDSNTHLSNAVITTGDFEGWTVAQVLDEAEKILGGCSSNYTASQLTEVLTAINECFVDGTTNTGFLENQ
jgi:hypothetical protein